MFVYIYQKTLVFFSNCYRHFEHRREKVNEESDLLAINRYYVDRLFPPIISGKHYRRKATVASTCSTSIQDESSQVPFSNPASTLPPPPSALPQLTLLGDAFMVAAARKARFWTNATRIRRSLQDHNFLFFTTLMRSSY